MNRKIKIKSIQAGLVFTGLVLFLFIYSNKNEDVSNENSVISIPKNEINERLEGNEAKDGDVFYNIEYSGFDLSGNRYILKAKEALSNQQEKNFVRMKYVEAFFYFKDDTILKVFSEKGVYNNKSLDMEFSKNVLANYEGSSLSSQKAEYSNSKNFLRISEKVSLEDSRGNFYADELFFDLKNQTLNMNSKENNKINLNLIVKWKKALEY